MTNKNEKYDLYIDLSMRFDYNLVKTTKVLPIDGQPDIKARQKLPLSWSDWGGYFCDL